MDVPGGRVYKESSFTEPGELFIRVSELHVE